MRSRTVWMIVTGLALALALLVAVQATGFLVKTAPTDNPPIAAAPSDTPDTGVTPVIFRTLNEYGPPAVRKLRISGTSEAEAVLVLLNRNERLRQIKADEAGNWNVEIDVIPDTPMVLEIVMFVEGGLNVRGDETVFRIPVPASAEAETDMAKPALIMVSAPGGPTRIVQSPFGGSPTDGPLSMGPIDYDDSGGVIFSGTTEEEGRVRVYAGGAAIGETRVGAGGRWNFIAGTMLPLGEYEIAAELLKPDGVRARVSVPFERLPPSRNPNALPSQAPHVRYEPFRWQIRRQLLGGGAQYTAIFAPAEAKALTVSE